MAFLPPSDVATTQPIEARAKKIARNLRLSGQLQDPKAVLYSVARQDTILRIVEKTI